MVIVSPLLGIGFSQLLPWMTVNANLCHVLPSNLFISPFYIWFFLLRLLSIGNLLLHLLSFLINMCPDHSHTCNLITFISLSLVSYRIPVHLFISLRGIPNVVFFFLWFKWFCQFPCLTPVHHSWLYTHIAHFTF